MNVQVDKKICMKKRTENVVRKLDRFILTDSSILFYSLFSDLCIRIWVIVLV